MLSNVFISNLQLRNSFRKWNERHFVLICLCFLFMSQLLCSLRLCEIQITYPLTMHWVVFRTNELTSQSSLPPSLHPSFPLSIPPSLPPSFPPFPVPFSHFSSHSTALGYIAIVASWKYYFINCKHNKISVMTNDPSQSSY